MMKKLIALWFISISSMMNAQVTDKVAHFGVGYVAGSISSGVTLINSNGKNEWLKSISVGTASGIILGTTKEVYDYKNNGPFDWKDLGVTVLGSTLGSITIKISINRYERKHLI